jgi:hypothetical protein
MCDWLEGCPAGCGELGCEPGHSPPPVPHTGFARAAGSLPGAGRRRVHDINDRPVAQNSPPSRRTPATLENR